jgi:glycosyltransferase involved in cell wall biosynthesis
MVAKKRVILLIPEEKGGIYTYGRKLNQGLREALARESRSGDELEFLEPLIFNGRRFDQWPEVFQRVSQANVDLIHIQHEFGLFGGKIPFLSRFSTFLRGLKKVAPQAKILITAHTVMPGDFSFPVKGSLFQRGLRKGVNRFLLPLLKRYWRQTYWQGLQGIVVHSDLQKSQIAPNILVETIPLFVPDGSLGIGSSDARNEGDWVVMVFGYFRWDKGQDIVIQALNFIGSDLPIRLKLIGSAARTEDQEFLEHCQRLRSSLRNPERCEIIEKHVSEEEVDGLFQSASLILAPFRTTTGSASISEAFARGKAILVSDLPLNRELNDRVKNCVSLFSSENPEDLAKKLEELLKSPNMMRLLEEGARNYRTKFSLSECTSAYLKVYRNLP